MIKKYREMGGNKPWRFYDKYFKVQNWGKSKEEIYSCEFCKTDSRKNPYLFKAKNIDINNPVRLIRAIEIAKALGKIPKIINKTPNIL